MKKREILIVVAHPDDETIWLGGTLLRTKFKKTILCLCRKNDSDRNARFRKACEILEAESHISDLDDSEKGNYKKISSRDIIKRILRVTKGKNYDYLFTHGENGEYGHRRHIEVHKAVVEMLEKKLLSAKKVFFFSYVKKRGFLHSYAICNSNADKLIKLNREQLLMKKNLIRNVYGFKRGGFEEKSSRKIEAFDVKK